MNRTHKRRLYWIVLFILGITIATSLILYALKQNINVFLTPQQLASRTITIGYHFRLGGIVKPGSVKHSHDSLAVTFIITDLKKEVSVQYTGVLPDLFREGKGVIAEGELNSQGVFIAAQVLAKHDENYMPKNVYQAMRAKVK